MEVLVADRPGVAGGAERLLAAAAPLLQADGLEITVATPDGPLAAWCREAGVPWRPDLPAASDVVVGWGAASVRWSAPVETARRIWVRQLTPRGRPDETAAASIAPDVVTCPTPAAATAQRALTPRAEVMVVPPGIDFPVPSSDEDRAASRRGLGLDPHSVAVGMVARIDPAKGQDRLVAAAAELRDLVPNLRVAFVGGPLLGTDAERDHDRALRDMVEALGLGDLVEFAGHADDPWPWHDALDIEVNLSTHEAFGLATVEALWAGTPVVATATQGSSFILAGEDRATLLPADATTPQVVSALAARVAVLGGDGGDARSRVGRQFGIGRFAEQLISVCRADHERFAAAAATAGGAAPSDG